MTQTINPSGGSKMAAGTTSGFAVTGVQLTRKYLLSLIYLLTIFIVRRDLCLAARQVNDTRQNTCKARKGEREDERKKGPAPLLKHSIFPTLHS